MAREFPQILGPFRGLRPRPSVRNNPQYCAGMINLVPGERSCNAPTLPNMPIPSGLAVNDWPSPQLARGDGSVILLFNGAKLYTVTGIDMNLQTVYDSVELTPVALQTKKHWHVVTLGKNLFFATNGSQVVYRFVSNPSSAVLACDFELNTVALDSAQRTLVLGGIESTPSLNWNDYFDAWLYRWKRGHEGITLDKNWAVYFKLYDIKDPYRLVPLMLGLEGDDAEFEVKPTILSCIEQGTIGFVQLSGQPAEGEILQILPIGARFIAYTRNGIFKLDWNEEKQLIAEEILSAGVAGRSCATGDKDHHFFVTAKGELWKHSMNGELSNHYYDEYLKDLQPERLIAMFDSEEREYYFTDGHRCYVAGVTGFYERSICPSSLIRYGGRLVGFYTQGNVKLKPHEFEIETVPLNFGTTSLKQSRFVEINHSDCKKLQIRVVPKFSSESEFIETLPWHFGSPKGDFFAGASFVEARFCLRGEFLTETASLETANVRFQFADGRTIRGPRGIQSERESDVQAGG